MEKHLNFFFLTDQLIKTILYWKNMKVYHREMYLQLVSITMLGPLNVFLILRVLPCQSEYTNYTDSCYIFLCIINCTVSFLSPYTIKDWYLLQTAYSVLTVFKSWRWTSSLLRGTSGLIYISVHFRSWGRKVRNYSSQRLGFHFLSAVRTFPFELLELLLSPEALKPSCGHW